MLRSSVLFGQVIVQVSPVGVHGVDEVELLFAGTGFDLFFPGKRISYPVEFLVPDKLIHIVVSSEGVLVLFVAVAVNTVFEGAGGSGVEDGVVFIGRNVCISFFWHGGGESAVLVWVRLLRSFLPRRPMLRRETQIQASEGVYEVWHEAASSLALLAEPSCGGALLSILRREA